MAEALSPSDRSSLAAERGPVNMAVGAVLVFESGRGLDYDAVVERLRTRLHLIPRYRQRLASAVPGGHWRREYSRAQRSTRRERTA